MLALFIVLFVVIMLWRGIAAGLQINKLKREKAALIATLASHQIALPGGVTR